jgi:ORC6 second cyclin-like domain
LYRQKVSIKQLGVKYGCASAIKDAAVLHREYYMRKRATLPERIRAHTNFSSPAYLAASFYVAVRQHKNLRLNRAKLIEESGMSTLRFIDLCDDVIKTCPELVEAREAIQRPDSKVNRVVATSSTTSSQQEPDVSKTTAASASLARATMPFHDISDSDDDNDIAGEELVGEFKSGRNLAPPPPPKSCFVKLVYAFFCMPQSSHSLSVLLSFNLCLFFVFSRLEPCASTYAGSTGTTCTT